jgi:signal transduction histidine kinase
VRRVRAAIALLAIGVAVPAFLLVRRAQSGLAIERMERHQAVAARAFDEMERALSRFLEQEEARPFEDYRFYRAGTGAAEGSRSPLSHLPAADFVLGYFQIDPDGSFHTPLRPRDLERARRAGDWPPPPDVARAVARLESEVPPLFRRRSPLTAPRDAGARAAAPPEGARVGAAFAQRRASAPRPAREEEREAADPDAYQVLESLNRAAALRAERQQKVVEPAAPRAADSAAPGRAAGLAVDPMVGGAADAEGRTLVLYRTVVRAEGGFRQGLLLDRAALGRWLEREVLRGSELDRYARVRFFDARTDPGAAGTTGDARDGAFRFSHRFAEPFAGVGAALLLSPLPGNDGAGSVAALSALLVLAVAGGLFALHRMVAVALHFAERRANFVAAVSHELRTPLTAIRMYAEMLCSGLVSSEAKRAEYSRTISDESERLSRLIENVLELARLERGRRQVAPRAGRVDGLLREVADKLAPCAAREGFHLRVDAEPDLPPVLHDRDALLQVLFNLVDNAIKYSREAGRREIVLEARRLDGRVAVGVRDFGPGVDRRQLSHVFEPFYRGEDELVRRAKGTGIGLALVRELAQRMGAAAVGANAEGGGFRVHLVFPPAAG